MAAGKLNALSVTRLGAGNHGDGDGLYLRVAGNSRTWAFRFKRQNKAHWISLGACKDFTLAEARQKARECRRKLFEGVDLLAETRTAQRTQAAAAVRTFGEAVKVYIEAHRAGWKSAKHGAQWQATLDQHAGALLPLPIGSVGVPEVLEALNAIWRDKPETASRVRGRIEAVLDYATARHWRTGDNPARWKGHLDALLPARSKVATVQHHAALPWADMPALMARLAESRGTGARCLAFAILTAARSMEARGARWTEIDIDAAVWTIPAARMKAKREHRVPLAPAALAILAEMRPLHRAADDLLFPGGRAGRPLTDVALSKALHLAAGRDDVTVHGCRSAFRDWCGEAVSVPREVAEAALAHTNKDRVEAAYARSDLFDRRRALMESWAAFVASPAAPAAGVVAPIRRRAAK